MNVLVFNTGLIFVIIFLLIVLSMVWPPDSPWAPWWRTTKKTARAMCLLAKVNKNDIVYDLGSGDGTALSIVSLEFGAKGVGIEIDPPRVFISKILIRWYKASSKISIIRGNFFDHDISKATVVFVYLVPKTLHKLEKKFIKELQPGTKIVSLQYQMNFPLLKKDNKHKLFLYKVPQNN